MEERERETRSREFPYLGEGVGRLIVISPSRRGHARLASRGRGQSFFFGLNAVVTLMGGMDWSHTLVICIIEERVRRRSLGLASARQDV